MRFPFRFDRAYRLAALPFGVTPGSADVVVDRDRLVVRFGLWRLKTPLTNITGWERSGGFTFVKTAGPPHVSFTDRGVTFATNAEAALCLFFVDPVKVLDPTGLLRHPGATLTVADPDALARVLTASARPR